MAKIKRPTYINQRAKSIVDIATGETEEKKKNKMLLKLLQVLYGAKGGKKGGNTRATKSLSAERRAEIAKKCCRKMGK